MRTAKLFSQRYFPTACCPQRGFTLVELTMTLVIAGVLAVSVMPRLFSRTTFESRGFADEVQASLRYAQKVAIAQHRTICVQFTLNSLALSVANPTCPGVGLLSLTGGVSYQITAPNNVTFSPVPALLTFDSQGRPNAGVVITVTADIARTITVEAETGYVHP